MDERIAHTAAFMLRCPGSSVPEATRVSKYSLEESGNPAKQMAICRSFAKATVGKLKAPSIVIDALTAATMTVSPLTTQTSTVRGLPSTLTMPRMPTTPTTPGGTRPTRPRPKQKLIRKLAGGMQKFRINKLAASDHAKRALKRATRWYAQEKNKPGRLTSLQIEAKVKKEFDGVGPHAATIQQYVKANIAGTSPLKIGVKGGVPTCTFNSLCVAFESFVRIQQINSRQGKITYKMLAARINALLRHDYWQTMLQRVLLATAKDLDVSTTHIAKDWRVRWTTFANISSWFDNWEFDLVELGLATRGGDGKVTISAEQLYFIINFDETCLSVDGSEGRRGGRPEVTLHDPRLLYTGK
jgi:hypothetical protein